MPACHRILALWASEIWYSTAILLNSDYSGVCFLDFMSNTAPSSNTFSDLIVLFINLYFIGIGYLNPLLRGCQPNFNFGLNSLACACVTHG
jgi:hypothetical protein